MALTINQQPSVLGFTKSPLLVEVQSGNTAQPDFEYKLEVSIWAGTTAPSTPTYTLSKLPNTSIGNKAIFNIARLIEAEFNVLTLNSFSGNTQIINQGALWVKIVAQTTWTTGSETTTGNTFLALPGYTLMSDATNNYNHSLGKPNIAMNRPSNTEVYNEFPFYVPVIRDFHDRIIIGYNNTSTTITLTQNSADSKNRVAYIDVARRLRVNHSWTGDFSYYLSDGTTDSETISVRSGCEPKYTVFPVGYLNRFGLWEVLYMSKKNMRSNVVKNAQYKTPHFISDYSVDTSRKGVSVFNTQTNVEYTLNSDWVTEAENDMFSDLYRSEFVCVYIEGQWVNVTLTSQQYTTKTSVNDKTFNHTITFALAYADENNIM